MKKDQKTKEEVKTIDASGMSLGRVASTVAVSLMGKDKASFERNRFSGRSVLVTNASKIKISSQKLENIVHKRYSGIPGGLRIIKASKTIEKKGFAELVKHSVYQMLPSNKIRKEMMKNLKIEN